MSDIVNISEKIEISKISIREIKEPDKIKCKSQDIGKLEQIVNAIDSPDGIKNKLNKIGELCGHISFEDQWRNGLYNCIRHTYGYMKRDKAEQIIEYKRGIYFDKLYQLKVILDHEQEIGSISPEHLQQLESSLVDLKRKILWIIKEEKYFTSQQGISDQIKELKPEDIPDSPDIFISICNQYYIPLILRKLHRELQLFDKVSFSELEDRYFVARLIILIGDLANELFGCYFPIKDDLFTAFRTLFFVRSKVIHCHKFIKEGSKDRDTINEIIKYLPQRFRKCINTTFWENMGDHDNTKSFLTEVKRLFQIFKDERKRERNAGGTESHEITNYAIMDNLDILISHASKILNEFGYVKLTSQKLERLNREYKSQLILLNVANRKSYPSNLDIEHKATIIRHGTIHLPIKSVGRDKSDNQKLERSEIRYKHIMDNINSEIEYLKTMESNNRIDREKKKYIMLYIVMVISQYVRDVGESGYSENSPKDEIDYSIDYLSNQMTWLIDGDSLKTLSIDTLYERNSIDYLYTFPEFLSNSISLITLCNVGISFFKLGLYQQAIHFVESSSNYLNECADKIILAEESKTTGQCNNKNRYWFFVNRTVANIYYSANRYDNAREKYEQINQEIPSDITELDNCEIQIEIINFLTDFAFYLTDDQQFGEAIKTFDKIINFKKGDIAIKMKFIEALYKHGDFERANQLSDSILDNCDDNIVRSRVLGSLVSICISRPDTGKEIADALICGEKLNNIQRDTFGIINAQFIFAKLKIMLAELRISSDLSNLEVEAMRLIGDLPSVFQRGPSIALIYMSFSWVYCRRLIKFDGESFKMAKDYLYSAHLISSRMVRPLLNIDSKLRAIGNCLSLACNKYCKESPETPESNIGFLNEVIIIEDQLKINQSSTLHNLAHQYKYLADNLALQKALNLNSKALAQIKKDKNKINRESQEIAVLEDCFLWSHQLAVERWDMKMMAESVLFYAKFMLANKMITRYDQMAVCKADISLFITFLEQLLNVDFVIRKRDPNIRMMKFFNCTFDKELRFENDILIRDNLEPLGSIHEVLNDFRQKILNLHF